MLLSTQTKKHQDPSLAVLPNHVFWRYEAKGNYMMVFYNMLTTLLSSYFTALLEPSTFVNVTAPSARNNQQQAC